MKKFENSLIKGCFLFPFMLVLHVFSTGYVLKELFEKSIISDLISLFVTACYLSVMILIILAIGINNIDRLRIIIAIIGEIALPALYYFWNPVLGYLLFIIIDFLLSFELFYFFEDKKINISFISSEKEINAAWIGALATIIAAIIGLFK